MVAVNEEKLKGIAYQTFEITCYMFPLEEWEIDEQGVVELGDDSVSAYVEFDGAAEGGIKIRVSPELLDAIAENMLGMEEETAELKEAALCEIANIICGNTVPMFASGDKICYIRPPKIVENGDEYITDQTTKIYKRVQMYLDEGVAELTIFLKNSLG